MNKIYETEDLFLKELDKSSARQVLEYYMRNKAFLEEWEIIRNEEFYTLDYQEKMLEEEARYIENKNLVKLWLFKKDEEEKVIGSIAFNNIVRGAFLSCHLGYKLDENQINKGYMTQALNKGIDIVFNELGLHRIEANIMPKNKRSLRVVEKLGFYNEGIAYKYLKINNRWEDHIHMVLRNEKMEFEDR